MGIIITYDISDKHTDFKNEMKKLGYKDKIEGGENCVWIYLPNTTLYHHTKTSVEAINDAKKVKQDLKIELERCIATIYDSWAAICGEPF